MLELELQENGCGIFQLLTPAAVRSFSGAKSTLVTLHGEPVFQVGFDPLDQFTGALLPVSDDKGKQRIQVPQHRMLQMVQEGNAEADFLHK